MASATGRMEVTAGGPSQKLSVGCLNLSCLLHIQMEYVLEYVTWSSGERYDLFSLFVFITFIINNMKKDGMVPMTKS